MVDPRPRKILSPDFVIFGARARWMYRRAARRLDTFNAEDAIIGLRVPVVRGHPGFGQFFNYRYEVGFVGHDKDA